MRTIRQDTLKNIKAQVDAKAMSETEQSMIEKEVEKLIKDANQSIDEAVKRKSDEVMKI